MTMRPSPPQLPPARDPMAAQPVTVHRRCALPESTGEALRAVSTRLGVSPVALFVQAFADVLGLWSTEPCFVLDLIGPLGPHQGREIHVDTGSTAPFEVRVKGLDRQIQGGHGSHPVSDVATRPGPSGGEPGLRRVTVRCGFDGGVADRAGDRAPFHGSEPDPGLACGVRDDGGSLVIAWDCLDALFAPNLAEDMLASFVDLLTRLAGVTGRVARTGGRGLGAEVALPEGQAAVRRRVNATAKPISDQLLHDMFWDQARRAPERLAVIANDRTLTYGALQTAAANLADRLQAAGARPNELVAIVMEKGWQQPVAAFGILESGAAYVPIEPNLPEERFHHLLRHARISVAVTQAELATSLPWPADVQLVIVDEAMLVGEVRPASRRAQRVGDLAYVIYTSGSTGQPKGVMIDHRGAVNTVLDVNDRFGVGPTDRVLALTPLSFDLSVYDLFGPLGVGGALVIPDAGSGRAPWQWADLLQRHGVTVWNTVPALMEMLVGYLVASRGQLSASVRLVMMSGDWIPVTLPDRIRALTATPVELVSLGGATEASIWSIWHPIGAVDASLPSIPYGKPLANQWFEVLDGALRQRPDWVPGELYVGGTGVAMGYWRDEEKTRQAFVAHPRTGARMYRLGDLARYLPDGTLEFLGREDFQVKIHGYRIELGEIEAALLAHSDVTAAVAVAQGTTGGGKRLVAYAATAAPDRLSDQQLRDHLAGKLPPHMVPAHIVVLDALPLTPNGKVDRRALPSPDLRRRATTA
ncbi:amino acid adenylation domain-containing protein [Micromonospora sp. CA-259024]|uniref:amino acid adenylation domain-containing protein n=1 Tax=Micromonospora sp. CA-259024 TaxID=3239965 RepID=UPI003D89C770